MFAQFFFFIAQTHCLSDIARYRKMFMLSNTYIFMFFHYTVYVCARNTGLLDLNHTFAPSGKKYSRFRHYVLSSYISIKNGQVYRILFFATSVQCYVFKCRAYAK